MKKLTNNVTYYISERASETGLNVACFNSIIIQGETSKFSVLPPFCLPLLKFSFCVDKFSRVSLTMSSLLCFVFAVKISNNET